MTTAGRLAARSGWGAHPGWLRLAASILAGLLLGAAIVTTVGLAVRQANEGRVLPGVTVAGVDVAGRTPTEAGQVLEATFAGLTVGQVTIDSAEGRLTLPFAAIDRRLDTEATVTAALHAGRGDGPLAEALSALRLAIGGTDLPVLVHYDEAALTGAIDRWAAANTRRPTDAVIAIDDGGGFTVLRSWPGVRINGGGVAERLRPALLDPTAPPTIRAAAEVEVLAPRIDDEAAAAAVRAAKRMSAAIAVTNTGETWTVDGATVRSWIGFGPGASRDLWPHADEAALRTIVAGFAERVERPAIDASYLVDRGGARVGVRAGRNGVALAIDGTVGRVRDLLERRALGRPPAAFPVAVATSVVEPDLTTAEATRIAPLMVRLGTWTTKYTVSAHNGFGANITVPARRLNGTVVGPGETFDFWAALGEVSFRTGYRLGGAIVGGHSVEGKALAGGICAASTTLFNAAVRAGYPSVARSPHWYAIKRYPLGLDATVSGSQSMRFRNDTTYPLLIRGIASPGVVTFEIWSVPTGRQVTIGKPIVSNVVRGYETVEYTDSLPRGTREQIEWAVDGKDVSVTITVRNAAGELIRGQTFESHYHRMVGITLMGTG